MMKTKPKSRAISQTTKAKRSNSAAAQAGAAAVADKPAATIAVDRIFPIVGIGASAGGLEAVTALLRALPPKPGMAIVLVQHLDPTHESAMATLLSRVTDMPVLEARNNQPLAADHVYVIPPNKLMVIAHRRLKLSPRKDSKTNHTPIDHFMKSLADEEGPRGVGVILSGSGGSDGTQGLLAIKSAGGITFAQDEKTAKYPAMPASAVAAGCVDFVLPPDKVAYELTQLVSQTFDRRIEETDRPLPAEEKAFEDILTTLRRQMAVDFTQYKHATLRRRVHRRMVLHKYETLKDYAGYLRSHAGEVRELYNDILIHVTEFFRDGSVYQMLKRKLFPRLIKNRAPEDTIRIWVPGCSTGEEVFSLAMCLVEFFGEKKAHFPVQIFGTDINENALERARAGVYPESIQTDVSTDRLRRFFLKCDKGFRINKSIREMCIFARQNVVMDPPFSNLDLVSCRNVLIYLGPMLQRKVMPLFHYVLKPSGHLLLGASETIGGYADLFTMMDKKAKVYSKRATNTRPPVTFGPPTLEQKIDSPVTIAPRAELVPAITDVQKQADRILLTHHTPAGVIVNRQLEVLQFRGRTGQYLEHAHGEATLNLLKMAREGLVIALRAAVTRAMKQNVRVREEGISVRQNGHFQDVHIEVVPFQVPPSRERFYLVVFESGPLPAEKTSKSRAQKEVGRKAAESAELGRLREELAATRESLQAIIEEQEATNEELRSANEEIMSSNEELQSTNEELETAKEELQSTNEELATLNDELESRNTELEHVNNDLHNLLASVNIPIVMVGSDLRIRRFTAVAEKMLNLIPTDVGRPLTDINLKVIIPQLGQMVTEVIDTLQTRDVEVQDGDQHWWSFRIRPYKTTDHKIDGAVVALVDIDMLKTGMERIGQRREFAEAIVNTVRQPLIVLDKDLVIRTVNQSFYRAFHVGEAETLNRRIYEIGEGQWNIPKLRTLLEDILPHNSAFSDFEVEHIFPDIGKKRMLLNARRMTFEKDEARLILLSIEDVT